MHADNAHVAAWLDEIALHLRLRGANPFRVAAYRNAAVTVRGARCPLAEILRREGRRGLEQLPGVGTSLSRKIAEMLTRGQSKQLDRLRHEDTTDVLGTLPNVGPRLAERIRRQLDVHSLEELLRAARSGKLRRVPGMGRKRVAAIEESLAARLDPTTAIASETADPAAPAVGELLTLDRQYRRQAKRGRLLRVIPKRFNPTGAAWLPVLRTQRGSGNYRVHYSNSARGHALGHLYDWVVIIRENKESFGQWTVVTAVAGPLRGKRVVRGRERECEQYYRRKKKSVQLRLPNMDETVRA
jgi:hypothetical protein